jgi:hypothetical protein
MTSIPFLFKGLPKLKSGFWYNQMLRPVLGGGY